MRTSAFGTWPIGRHFAHFIEIFFRCVVLRDGLYRVPCDGPPVGLVYALRFLRFAAMQNQIACPWGILTGVTK